MSGPWWQPIARAFLVYVGLFLLFRLTGRKQLGEMSPFDFVLLLIISEAVSNALTGEDNSLTAALLCAATLIGMGSIVDRAAFHSRKIEKLVEGEARLLVVDGVIRQKELDREKITLSELKESLRGHGLRSLDQVRFGILETNGKISWIPKDGESG